MNIEMSFSCITFYGLRKKTVELFEDNCSQLINLSYNDDIFKLLVFSFNHRKILHNKEHSQLNDYLLESDYFPLYIDDDYDGDTYYTLYSCCEYPYRFNIKFLRVLFKENSLTYRISLSDVENFQVMRLRLNKSDLMYLRLLDEIVDFPDEDIPIDCRAIHDPSTSNGHFFIEER